MAYKRISPQPVVEGGTGAQTLTGVLTGNGTSAITANAVTQYNVIIGGASNAVGSVAPSATSGVPLISQGAASNPAFGTAVVAGGGTGIATTTAYAPICGGTTATGAFQAATTGFSTSGYVLTSTGNASLPSWQAAAGGVTGPGSSTTRDIATWNGAGGSALYDNPGVTISSAGVLQNTKQPAFQARRNADIANVTGDGTVYTVVWDQTNYDQASNFDGTSTFTAPVTGKYAFCFSILINTLTTSDTVGYVKITTTGGDYLNNLNNPGKEFFVNELCYMANTQCAMTAGDTAVAIIVVAGSSKSVNVQGNGGAGAIATYFAGYLIC